MKSPILIFPVDADGVPYESRSLLDTRISDELHRYLLELDTFPGKNPATIVISESADNKEIDRPIFGGTPGIRVITADGKIAFHSYSGGTGKGLGQCPDLKPVRLRQGWAVWVPASEDDGPMDIRVRIYGTENEALSACVLFGG